MDWRKRAADIRALVLDIDGVLTDGRLGYDGERRLKFFDARDGHAIRMAIRGGLLVGTLSGRDDPASRQRTEDLGMSFAYHGAHDKGAIFRQLLAEQDLAARECCYVGDDVVDIPVLLRAGIACCVPDSSPELFPRVDYVTTAAGGHGAVREVIVALLTAQGKWDELMMRYTREAV